MTGKDKNRYLFVSMPRYELPIPGTDSSCGDTSFSDGIWLFFLASSSFCDFCRRTEDEYEVFIVLVLAEDINCHPGQSGKVPLYWQFPPEPHIYISGKSGSSLRWWWGWASCDIYLGKIRLLWLQVKFINKKLLNGRVGYVILVTEIKRTT